jgi:diguanylate cyclase (GGDEF)-like protein/hemerythrin-like metal-binding protein
MVDLLLSGARYRNCEAQYRRKDGTLFWGRTSASIMLLHSVPCVVAMTRDITEQKKVEEEIRHLAYYDPLTSAWNRRHFEEVVEAEMHRSLRYGQPLALLVMDIDHFKRINDAFGHAVGDGVLEQLAERSRGAIRLSDSLTRWGGEEFIVLMPNTNLAMATILAERIRTHILANTFDPAGQITVSLGVAEYLPPAALEPWLERADQAMYRAKHGGRNRVEADPARSTHYAATGHAEGNFAKLVWSNTYRCGNPTIDAQHENLFRLANDLFDAMHSEASEEPVSPIVASLLSELAQHFHDEESILLGLRFAGLREHQQKHAALLDQAVESAKAFQTGTLTSLDLFEFLSHKVVAQHVLKADREFFHLMEAS